MPKTSGYAKLTQDNTGRGQDQSDIIETVDEILSEDSSDEFAFSKKRKTTEMAKAVSREQWINKYKPLDTTELCINPRKLKEVSQALHDMILKLTETRLLVLTGPAGSSKSTCIKLLADELVSKYKRSRYGLKHQNFFGGSNWIEYSETSTEDSKRATTFFDFLADAKSYVGKNLAVIIVEELPNVFNELTLKSFRETLDLWLNLEANLPPIVLCITDIEIPRDDTKKLSFDIYNRINIDTLLGPVLWGNQKTIKQIKFNSIAPTFLKKTISKIVSRESSFFKSMRKEEINEIVSNMSEIGDIRSAICNLQFITMGSRSSSSLISFHREKSLQLFHAIGKIMYASSKHQDLSDQEKNQLSVSDVASSYQSISLLNLSLLENYTVYNNSDFSIDIASEIAEALSIADILESIDEGAHYGIASTRMNLNKCTISKTNSSSLRFPRHSKMIKSYYNTRKLLEEYQKYLNHFKCSLPTLNMIDGYYLPLIYNSMPYKKVGQVKYGRLGGPFRYLEADSVLPLTEADDIHLSKDQFFYDIETAKMIFSHSKMKRTVDESELSDPVETDIDTDDIFDDSINEIQICNLVSQSKSQQASKSQQVSNSQQTANSPDVFSSDPELEIIYTKY